jgi:hypothetical protein
MHQYFQLAKVTMSLNILLLEDVHASADDVSCTPCPAPKSLRLKHAPECAR